MNRTMFSMWSHVNSENLHQNQRIRYQTTSLRMSALVARPPNYPTTKGALGMA